MNRTRFPLLIALSTFTLTGCGEDKAAPPLSSPDRSGRTEAVNVARHKDGAPAPTAPTADKPAEAPSRRSVPAPRLTGGQPAGENRGLTGCWTMQAGDQIYFWIFSADGTCKEAAGIVGPLGKLFFVFHAEGDYRLLPGKEIEVTYHAGPKERKVRKLTYRLSKEALELDIDGHRREFKRITRQPPDLPTLTHKEHAK